MVLETPVAIACRVAPSFLRIGQIELFARRARAAHANPTARAARAAGVAREESLSELLQLVEHVIFREFAAAVETPLPDGLLALEGDALARALADDAACAARYGELLAAASQRLAAMTAEWMRVGFVQGNFNSDNCLVRSARPSWPRCC